MEKLIKGIHHVSIKAQGQKEYERVTGFYRDVLGMTVTYEWKTGDRLGMMIDTGNAAMEISSTGKGETGRGSFQHVALKTKDVNACVEAVRAAGYQITIEPLEVNLGTNPNLPIRVAFCIGPAGEEIEFFDELWNKD